jgi:peroxiredoxin
VDVPLLSDWNGDATRAFGIAFEPLGMQDVPGRASFLVEDGERIRESWRHGGELPDVDAVLAAARS